MSSAEDKEDVYHTRQTLLMRAHDQKDQAAWDEFVAYYRPFIGIILRHMKVWEADIEDITQTVVLNLWKKLDSFEPGRCKFRTWLSTIIRNAVFTFQKKAGKDRARDNSYYEEKGRISDNDLAAMFDREWKTYLTNVALENIKKNFSGNAIQVFLFCLENKPVEQIAEELDIKENSVYRLKKRVQEQLGQEIKRLRNELEN
ncbi:MAG: sigma-70 family RNA polymerase sigma factor [Lentisphaeraceae bacterium]|nr:sigma-70 family RNA polymerase sigma factor [Lentisphaeraceae bacterium]